jgi:hypothetical protein
VRFDWLLSRFRLPFRTLTSLRIKAKIDRRHSARLPNPPDSLSLPEVAPIASFNAGSSFLVRYVSGDLLFLKHLGTFLTMLPKAFCVKGYFRLENLFSTTFIVFILSDLRGVCCTTPVHKSQA